MKRLSLVTCLLSMAFAAAHGGEVPFGAGNVITAAYDTPFTVRTGDVDGDGDADVLAASSDDDKIAWFENTDGAGAFGPERVISTAADGPVTIFVADIDGDGDLDLVSGSVWDNEAAWFENTDGAGTFGAKQVISDENFIVNAVFAGDVDGDGDLDVLISSQEDNTVAWCENLDGQGSFGSRQVVGIQSQMSAILGADIDRDGDLDIVAASRIDNKVTWYENLDGQGSFGAFNLISTAGHSPSSIFAEDIDGDGDLDVVVASWNDSEVAWFENTDGAGAFGSQQIISTNADRPNWILVDDVDGDGDPDVLTASQDDDKIAWHDNAGDGSAWVERVVALTADFALVVHADDLDGDGDLDVLSGSYDDDTVAWYENRTIHGDAEFSHKASIAAVYTGYSVHAADIDRDGDNDVVAAVLNGDLIEWYENDSGDASSWTTHTISTEVDQPTSVTAADLDGDGDLDVLSSSNVDDKLAWYENTDGDGTFGSQQIVSVSADGPFFTDAGDVDGDGDVDVLSASFWDDRVAWYENTNGQGSFGPQQSITTAANAGWSVRLADLDGDGDGDVLAASRYDNKIAWHENTAGDGSAWTNHLISGSAMDARSAIAADVDGDGDLDVLSASQDDDTVAWYENTDGSGTFGPANVISATATDTWSVAAADLDGDGDVDVVAGAPGQLAVIWYENTDGSGTTWLPTVMTTDTYSCRSLFAADLDGDGDGDVLSAGAIDVEWFENRGGQFALRTVDLAPGELDNGATVALLSIEVEHLGRPGDGDLELATLELLFEEQAGVVLDTAEAAALLAGLSVYLDDGSGEFEAGNDTPVTTVSNLALTGGVQTIPLPDGDPRVAVALGTPRTYLVVAEATADVSDQALATFRVTHVTEASSSAEDRAHDIPLALRYTPNVSTALVNIAPAAGAVPDGSVIPGVPLLLDKGDDDAIDLTWGPSCRSGDTDYIVYRGVLGQFDSHGELGCSTDGQIFTSVMPAAESTYFLVVPRGETREGSYGWASDGSPREQGASACLPKNAGACD